MTHDPKKWPIVEVNDPSTKRGCYVCWFAFAPDDFVYLVRAKHVPDGSFDEMATGIKSERAMLPQHPRVAIMDRRGGQYISNKDLNRTWFNEFHDRGLHYFESTDAPMEALHDWLRPIFRPGLEKDVPKLRICESAARDKENPFWALQRFVWDPTKTKAWQYKQAGKDWIDCMRYLAGAGLTYHGLIAKPEQGDRSIATSYSQGRGSDLEGDLESILLQRGLMPEDSSLALSYEQEPISRIRERGSPF